MNHATVERIGGLTTREKAEFFLDLAKRLEPRFVVPADHPEIELLGPSVRRNIEATEAKLRGEVVDLSGMTAAFLARDVATELGDLEAADAALAAGTAAVIAYSLDSKWFSNDGNIATWAEKSHNTEGL